MELPGRIKSKTNKPSLWNTQDVTDNSRSHLRGFTWILNVKWKLSSATFKFIPKVLLDTLVELSISNVDPASLGLQVLPCDYASTYTVGSSHLPVKRWFTLHIPSHLDVLERFKAVVNVRIVSRPSDNVVLMPVPLVNRDSAQNKDYTNRRPCLSVSCSKQSFRQVTLKLRSTVENQAKLVWVLVSLTV